MPESTVSMLAPMSQRCICLEVSRCMTAPPAGPVARILGMRKKAMNTLAPTQKTPRTMWRSRRTRSVPSDMIGMTPSERGQEPSGNRAKCDGPSRPRKPRRPHEPIDPSGQALLRHRLLAAGGLDHDRGAVAQHLGDARHDLGG